MRVHEILNSKSLHLVTVGQGSTLTQASQIMSKARVGTLVVVASNGEAAGTLSERDMICFIAKNGPAAVSQNVGQAMAPITISASPNDSVTDVMRIMTEQRERHLTVYDGAKLVGVISIGDILKSRIAEKDQESAVLRDLARASLALAA